MGGWGGGCIWGPRRRLGCGLWGTPGIWCPEADSSQGWSPGSTLPSLPGSFWLRVSSPGGPWHHDPEEQVEKIRWQHHFDQLHPQTGRRRAQGSRLGRKPSARPPRAGAAGNASARRFSAAGGSSGWSFTLCPGFPSLRVLGS